MDGAVALTVDVPIAPPRDGRADRNVVAYGGWGRFATTDGDGAGRSGQHGKEEADGEDGQSNAHGRASPGDGPEAPPLLFGAGMFEARNPSTCRRQLVNVPWTNEK